ncbi:MAG: hypothetical protein K2M06_04060 [Muribaculaceae bacterium]|nr:hypothetical protein [Muribaculaceae bacterium]
MRLFNRDGEGAAEIVAAIGLISDDISFDKWEPILPLGIRDVEAIIGPEVVRALADFYEGGEEPTDEMPATATTALRYLQQAVAFFTWLKIIPTLDAQHGDAGRAARLGENEKGLTALEKFHDEENIMRLAYEATDALIAELDREAFEFWTSSRKFRMRDGLLIRSKEQFDEYYNIGSHRLFVTLLPMIREVQASDVAPVIGRKYMAAIIAGDEEVTPVLMEPAARAVALLTMKKAVERLPVEVLPEGIVQVQQSQPVKSRLKAEKAAREAVAASLGSDASRYLAQLQDLVAELDADNEPVDRTVPGPIVHSKGMSF